MYYIYFLRCHDNSLYIGITTDLKRRFQEHQQRGKRGAKYTKSHYAMSIETAYSCQTKSQACRLEYQLKTLNKKQKEDIVKSDQFLELYLSQRIKVSDYQRLL